MKSFKPLFLIIGKSGSGKDYFVDEFCNNHRGFSKVLSYTTRQQRFPNENTHTFISKDEYRNLTDIVASTEFNGEYYCATREMVELADFYIVDLDGALDFFGKFKNCFYGREVYYLYLDINPFKRFFRMVKRNSVKSAINRIINDRKVFKYIEYCCVNCPKRRVKKDSVIQTKFMKMCKNKKVLEHEVLLALSKCTI